MEDNSTKQFCALTLVQVSHKCPCYVHLGQAPNGVVVLDDDHLVHVPMSLGGRTSALDLWLLLKRSVKVY